MPSSTAAGKVPLTEKTIHTMRGLPFEPKPFTRCFFATFQGFHNAPKAA